ncbi:MAG: hypothetical protein R2748_24070 [Bryobacterales bacterium]
MVAYNIVNGRYLDKALDKAKQADMGVIAMKVARPVNHGATTASPTTRAASPWSKSGCPIRTSTSRRSATCGLSPADDPDRRLQAEMVNLDLSR